ncbi:MAG: GAF domain-containing protein [Calditrichaeota bacterium]|nr:MAG: GAF domain-containing protein [Calditrichota bacterium]
MPYKIISKIASGTFGTVYKIQKSTNGEFYALKLIHENYKTPKEIKRIKRGFETAQKVSHPNCVKMIEWYEEKDQIGFVMEFVDSVETQNLASSEKNNSVGNKNFCSLQEKISKIIQIANGLEALHSRGIINRDLKPANILETKEGQIKITDFDLVKLDDSSTLTASGAFLGTAKYSSPEQCQNSAKIDHRSDLYSLGIIFYKLLTGRLPFDGESITSIILGHLRSPLTSPSYYNSEIPFEIEDIVKKLLSKNPNERFASAKAVTESLTNFLQNSKTRKGTSIDDFLLFPEFIGREEELQKLQKIYSKAQSGKFQFALIGGNSGSGKSKLWKEFATALNFKDTFYLQTKAQPNSQSFDGLKSILNGCLEELENFSDSEKIEFVGKFGRDFQIILPQIANYRFFKKLPQTTKLAENEVLQRLYESLCKLLEKLSDGKTLVLFFDDVQWSENESVNWIKYAQNYFADKKVFIAGTVRKNEFENSNFSKNLEGFEKIQLEDLNLEQIKNLVSSMLGKVDPIEKNIAEMFLKKTNGNPLFIQELMFHFLQNGILFKKSNEWRFDETKLISENLPQSIHSVLFERIKSLKRDSKKILQIASLFKRPFTVEFIKSFFPELSSNKIAEVLKNANFENYVSEKSGLFSFYHDSVKETLEISISQSQKVKLHKIIAENLESNYSESIIPELAHHFFEAKIINKAKKYNLLASETAFENFATSDAINFISKVIEFEKSEVKLVEFNILKASFLERIGDIDEALKVILNAHKLALKIDDKKLIADTFLARAKLKIHNLVLEEGFIDLEKALEIYKKFEVLHKISETQIQIGKYYTTKCESFKAIEAFENALKIAEKLNDKGLKKEIYYTLIRNYVEEENYEKAFHFLDKCLKLSKETNDLDYLNLCYSTKGTLLRNLGKPQEALEIFEISFKNSEEIGNNYGIIHSTIGISNIYYGENQFSKSIHFLKIAYNLAHKLNYRNWLINCCNNLCLIYCVLGKLDESDKYNQELFELNENIEEFKNHGVFYKNSAIILHAQKRFKEAIEFWDKSISFRQNDPTLGGILYLKANSVFEIYDFNEAKKINKEAKIIAQKCNDKPTLFKTKILSHKIDFNLGLQKSSLEGLLKLIEKEENQTRLAEEYFEFCNLYSKNENLTLLPGKKIKFEDFRQKAIELHKNLIKNDESFVLKERLEILESLKNKSGIFQSGLLNSLIPLMEPESVLNETIEYLIAETKSDNCFIILKNKSTGKLEPCSFSPSFKDVEIDFSKSILNETVQFGKPILVENALENEKFSGNESIVGKIFLSVISIPLKVNNEVIGAIYLDRTNPKQGVFEKSDAKKVEEFGKILLPIIQKQKESLHQKIESQIRELGIFVGNSLKMKEVYEEIENAASYNFPVYIFGETGTGKELVANALHKFSPRRNNPFVAINCSAIPKDLAESELFGHKKGAFTGATFDKKGVFELAENGTLLLDEIGDLSLDNQAKILRVIQERKLRVIGSEKSKSVNVRILIATHKDLEQEVSNGNFREDLLHRLDVLKITIPPLRERTQDIPLLAFHILNKFNSDYGKKINGFSDEVLNIFSEYFWKGNVRELQNVIIKAAVECKENRAIGLENLSLPNLKKEEKAQENIFDRTENFSFEEVKQLLTLFEGETLMDKISLVEKAIFAKVLEDCGGNKSKVAKKLGISRTQVHRILDRIKF